MSDSAGRSRKRPSFLDPATNTPHFSWKISRGNAKYGEEVFCERVPLAGIADEAGTPTYVYSRAAIEDAYREIDRGLRVLPHTICFAVKANGDLSILKHLAKMGSRVDVLSCGGLHQV